MSDLSRVSVSVSVLVPVLNLEEETEANRQLREEQRRAKQEKREAYAKSVAQVCLHADACVSVAQQGACHL